MPFYEYQCKSCGHELEAMQKVSEAPLKKCPDCGKPQLTRLMSAPVFRLKGGGWYETDFKGDKDKQRNLADRPDDAPKEAKEADAKPADDKAKDGNAKDGKEAKSPEAKPEAPAAKESPSTEKPAGKSDKPSGGSAQKPAGGTRGAGRTGRSRRKPIKVKRRR
jgi:putative FmdB family regulatory protein